MGQLGFIRRESVIERLIMVRLGLHIGLGKTVKMPLPLRVGNT